MEWARDVVEDGRDEESDDPSVAAANEFLVLITDRRA
jgi:hypothetical protein